VELSRALALGSLEVGRQARITERLFQSPDHPVLAGFQEGEYLSTIVAHVTRRD
jgi:23S rRNA G2069 N7-methylase RlmK/C1962 C5-methylase RlmI